MTPHETVKQSLLELKTTVDPILVCRDPMANIFATIDRAGKALALLDTHTLVPNEPAEEMINHKYSHIYRLSTKLGYERAVCEYKAMIEVSK